MIFLPRGHPVPLPPIVANIPEVLVRYRKKVKLKHSQALFNRPTFSFFCQFSSFKGKCANSLCK